MIKRMRFPKIFFGWWTVIASGLLSFLSASYTSYGFSALFKPMASELGFSRTATSVPASISRLEGGVEGPLAGWVTDRFGPRWITMAGIFFVGLSLMLMYFINSLWAFYLVWGVMLGTAQNISHVPPRIAIYNWFVKKRGLALSIMMVLSGLSGVIGLTIIAWLNENQGWRSTCFLGGAVIWVIGLPLTWFFFKQHRPEYYGLLPDGATAKEEPTDVSQMIDRGVRYAAEVEEAEFTLRQAMRTPAFWLLVLATAVHGLAQPVMNIHCIPFLTDRGIDPLKAAAMMSIYIGVSIPFRVVGGFIIDHLRKERLRFAATVAYLLQMLGFGAFLLHQTITMIYVWFVLFGIGQGLAFALSPMRARYFGRKAIGSIEGTSQMLGTPVGVIAPVYAGWVYDTTGSYTSAFTVVAGLCGAAAVITAFVLPPKPPAQSTDIRKFL